MTGEDTRDTSHAQEAFSSTSKPRVEGGPAEAFTSGEVGISRISGYRLKAMLHWYPCEGQTQTG